MKDKNGVEIRTGDIVRIENAYFKNDNGTFLVQYSPGDPMWSGKDYSMRRIGKKGVSKAKYSLNCWPLHAYTNSRELRAESNAWNAEHASIEVIPHGDMLECAIQYFCDKKNGYKEEFEYYKEHYGNEFAGLEHNAAFCDDVIERISES